jgi:hypothetical protein
VTWGDQYVRCRALPRRAIGQRTSVAPPTAPIPFIASQRKVPIWNHILVHRYAQRVASRRDLCRAADNAVILTRNLINHRDEYSRRLILTRFWRRRWRRRRHRDGDSGRSCLGSSYHNASQNAKVKGASSRHFHGQRRSCFQGRHGVTGCQVRVVREDRMQNAVCIFNADQAGRIWYVRHNAYL